jgi:hypothetical protein
MIPKGDITLRDANDEKIHPWLSRQQKMASEMENDSLCKLSNKYACWKDSMWLKTLTLQMKQKKSKVYF